jgi:hypothetical protein
MAIRYEAYRVLVLLPVALHERWLSGLSPTRAGECLMNVNPLLVCRSPDRRKVKLNTPTYRTSIRPPPSQTSNTDPSNRNIRSSPAELVASE